MYSPALDEVEKQKFLTIVSDIKEAVIIVDTQSRISYFNRAAEELTGYKMSEAQGSEVGSVIKFFDAEREIAPHEYAPINEIDIEGVVFRQDAVNLIDRDQNPKVVSIVSKKMRGGSTIGIGCIIVLENVFHKSEFERMKLDFVAMSVHLLRTPLTIVKGYLTALLVPETLSKLNSHEVENLVSAINGADKLRELVENLLDLSEMQKESYSLKETAIHLDELVKSVVNEFRDKAQLKGIDIIYVPPTSQLPPVKADVLKIKEVLKNLISNAIHATDIGLVEASILRKDGYLQVAIKDTGKGIPSKNLPLLFSKFYRIKAPLEMEDGQGLGLYISKRIILSHKGEIWVESTEGVGSTFYFTLPIS